MIEARTIGIAAALALFAGLMLIAFGMAAPNTALAGVCVYSDGTTDNGPCLEVRNGYDYANRTPLDLWCQNGPTSSTHKIILRGSDSFTCKGNGDYSVAKVRRKQIGCLNPSCFFKAPCTNKTVRTLRHVDVNTDSFYQTCE